MSIPMTEAPTIAEGKVPSGSSDRAEPHIGGSPDELVTIAITTFNRADGFLNAAIASALAQTYRNIEVIVADNCSDDHTGELVAGFRDPRIDYVRHESNIGPYRNFNFCVDRARGKYFCLLHDDDLMDPDFVSSCIDRARDGGRFGVIQAGTRVIDGGGNIMWNAPNRGGGGGGEDFVAAWFGKQFSPYLCTTLFVTGALREIGGFEAGNILADVRAQYQIALKFGWLTIDDIKGSFRYHDSKLTHATKVKAWCVDSANLMREMLAAVPPERRRGLKRLGRKMLASMNFRRASHVESTGQRILANLTVMRMFGSCRHCAFNLGFRTKLHRAMGAARTSQPE
jgi:glycosyltransferase involved in cell wall biosynthesis